MWCLRRSLRAGVRQGKDNGLVHLPLLLRGAGIAQRPADGSARVPNSGYRRLHDSGCPPEKEGSGWVRWAPWLSLFSTLTSVESDGELWLRLQDGLAGLQEAKSRIPQIEPYYFYYLECDFLDIICDVHLFGSQRLFDFWSSTCGCTRANPVSPRRTA